MFVARCVRVWVLIGSLGAFVRMEVRPELLPLGVVLLRCVFCCFLSF